MATASSFTTRSFFLPGAKAAPATIRNAALMRRQAALGRAERRKAEKRFKPLLRDLFDWVATETIRRGMRRAGLRRVEEPAVVGLDVWGAFNTALNDVMRDWPQEAVTALLPEIMNTARRGYEATARSMGDEVLNDRIEAAMRGSGPKIANRITSIGETTRERFRTVIQKAADEGVSPAGLAEEMYERFNEVSVNRIPTIARTEMMNAYNDGSVVAFQGSSTVTHVSVIGCMSRERDRWGDPGWAQFMYRGESTCNIEDVPVAECHLLNFHYNHTGCMVASKFRSDEEKP